MKILTVYSIAKLVWYYWRGPMIVESWWNSNPKIFKTFLRDTIFQLMDLLVNPFDKIWKFSTFFFIFFIEKRELVDLFCSRPIPVRQKKSTDIFTTNLGFSLQNLRENPSLGKFLGKLKLDKKIIVFCCTV